MVDTKDAQRGLACNALLCCVSGQALVAQLLNQAWHKRCEIIEDYMPPYPRPDTRPRLVIRFNSTSDHKPFLRYSQGPRQGFLWDVYGDDFQTKELAVIALANAPAPVSVDPITFELRRDVAT